MKTDFEFKKAINGKGFYAKISLEAKKIESKSVSTSYTKPVIWSEAVEFAISYYYEKYRINNSGGLIVHVLDVQSYMIDTSFMVVFYTTYKALSQAIEDLGENIYLNEVGDFIVKK